MKENINKNFKIYENKKKWYGIVITDTAALRIYNLMLKNLYNIGLRLNIKKSGCAGFKYSLDKVNLLKNDDIIFMKNKAKIYVSKKIMPFIDGTKIDYVKQGLNKTFKFINPNAQYLCGCGYSFNI